MSRPVRALVNTEELGRAIRRRREELGISLRDAANETAVSASTLSRIENGTENPTQITSRDLRPGLMFQWSES